jgi:hypothetical protein
MGKYLRQLARVEIAKGDLKAGPALLLLTICDRVRDDVGELYAGERTVASWIGRSQPTYRKWRADLIKAGLMMRLGGRPGVAARYWVFPPLSESTGVISSDDMEGENPSEQGRKHGRAIEPKRTSPVSSEESVSPEDSMEKALQALIDGGFDFEVIPSVPVVDDYELAGFG